MLFNSAVIGWDYMLLVIGKWVIEYGALVEWYWQGVGLITAKKTCLIATLSTTNSTWNGLQLKPLLCSERLAINHLRHGKGTVELEMCCNLMYTIWYIMQFIVLCVAGAVTGPCYAGARPTVQTVPTHSGGINCAGCAGKRCCRGLGEQQSSFCIRLQVDGSVTVHHLALYYVSLCVYCGNYGEYQERVRLVGT